MEENPFLLSKSSKSSDLRLPATTSTRPAIGVSFWLTSTFYLLGVKLSDYLFV